MTRDTLVARVEHAIEIKHSRFLAQAAPVASPEAATAFFEDAGDPAATHNCWAWRIDGEYRFNDDGEPASTAGRPILAAIEGQGLDRVAVVVTRWYGGIKLGAGGLVRAYGGCASECLRTAARVPLVRMAKVDVRFGFEHTGAVHGVLAQMPVDKEAESFDAGGARLRLQLPADAMETLKARLRDATRDQVRLENLEHDD